MTGNPLDAAGAAPEKLRFALVFGLAPTGYRFMVVLFEMTRNDDRMRNKREIREQAKADYPRSCQVNTSYSIQ
jgi:hypothetical protein